VASDRGAIGDVVENGRNGFRIDVSDAAALEHVLLAIDQAPEKYRRRTNHRVSLRSFDQQVDELVNIYRCIARGSDEGDQAAKVATVVPPAAPAAVAEPMAERGPHEDEKAAAGI
jgi:hypothetical protein